jgi:DNA (cytosine-5)-methyltransferase 1
MVRRMLFDVRLDAGCVGVIYGSVCSGIEAASVAWQPLGWKAAFYSEIEKFPRAVLAHRYPDVPLHGDFTTIGADNYGPIDILVGGTPCQSFSIAGLRGGLADDRGNLALEYLRLAERKRPRWLVWENVPGVLSSNGGRDFGSILGGMVELGYGFAYRVLDAQYVRVDGFSGAVPQRRRRVFVVGYLGDWRRAAAVLFERESLSGNPAPRREAGQGIAADVAPSLVSSGRGVERTGETRGQDPVIACAPVVSPTLRAGGIRTGGDRPPGTDVDTADSLIACAPVARCVATRKGSSQDYETTTMVAHALRGEGFDASEDGTGRGTPIVPVAKCMPTHDVVGTLCSEDSPHGARGLTGLQTMLAGYIQPVAVAGTMKACKDSGGWSNSADHAAAGYMIPVAFSSKDHGADASEGIAPTLRAMGHSDSHANGGGQIAIAIQERAVSENPDSGPDGAGVRTDGASYTLEARTVPQAVAFDMRGRDGGAMLEGPHDTANIRAASGGSSRSYVADQWAVRRLTPTECHRLQGFPDDHCRIPWRGKPADQCPDGPQYKALGNSMAVNVMRWIGQRIQMVEDLAQ